MSVLDRHTIESAVAEAAAANPIRTAHLFGSYARGEADNDSDVDLRIECLKGFTLFMLGGFGQQLENKLGRRVDIACGEDSFFPRARCRFDQDKVLLYEKR